MQFCVMHWDQLRAAIDRRGLSSLVARSGADAADTMIRQIKGEAGLADFDPLMEAHWAISAQYLKDVGLTGMSGDKCPVCEVEKSKAGRGLNWIEGAAEDQLKAAREIGLAPQQQ